MKELARAAELCGGALLPGHHAAAILGRRAEWRLRQMEVLGAAARVAEPEARRVL
ncbi:MAG: hypothetical protein IPI67_17735 [Myxococcales bacterium]|nr:hypothetical protein [Myxococcales bacterium]